MPTKKQKAKKNIKHATKKDGQDQEARLEKALEACNNGMSVAKAAKEFGVPEGTLRGRKKGRTSRREAHNAQQALSPELERVLCSWGKFFGFMGLTVTKERLLTKAKEVAPQGIHLGKTWWRRFRKRNESALKFKKAQALDPNQARNFNRKAVADHFERWREAHQDFDIPPKNMWNMDEKAIQLGGGRQGSNRKFFFDTGQDQVYKVKSDDLKMVTVIECISAAGVAMPPTFISPSGDLGDWWEVDGVGA